MIVMGLLAACCGQASAAAPPPCPEAIARAERALSTAPGLLAAIGVVESGRADPQTRQRTPWPWTVTAEGVGTFYASQQEAIQAVEALRARGVASVDVGCMQVNLLHHPAAFRDLAEAFDPVANARYAARFLVSLKARLGDWAKAAEAYHSMTPERGAQYGRLIAAVWAGAPVPVAQGPGGVEVIVFPGGGQMRVLRDGTSEKPGRVAGFLTGP